MSTPRDARSDAGVQGGPDGTPHRVFAAMRLPDYRRFFYGQLASNTGTWMQFVAQDWLVLRLTGRSFDVGIASALQSLPVLVLGMVGGVAADRYAKRTLLVSCQFLLALCAAALAALTLADAVTVHGVFAAALLTGAVSAFSAPALQSFVAEVVGPQHLRNAVSLGALNFQSARLVGPLLAGILIPVVGIGWAFAVNAASYGIVIGSLLAIRGGDGSAAVRGPRTKGQVREGLRHVRRCPELLWPITLVGFVCTLGYNFPTLLTGFADTFGSNAREYSFMTTALGLGAVAGALVSAWRGGSAGGHLVRAAWVFAGAEAAAAVAPGYLTFVTALVAVGAVGIVFSTTANSTVQLSVSQQMRGRVMGLYSLVYSGGTTLGAPVVGWAVDNWGARAALASCAAVAGAGALLVTAGRGRSHAGG
ncbi:MFS transporter [Streptomyces sp. NPDC048521]|uniref:MFS transporter n=1 Tax=Streptomyces sp. NPDC048521 TaxID=3365566 RepID=UPI0037150D41